MKTKNFLNESLNMKNAITPYNGSTSARHWLGNGPTKFHKNLGRVVALLCLLLTIGVGNARGDYYTITFNGSNSESTALSGAAADITGSSSYVTGNISSVTKSYGPTSDGVKVGASSNAGSFTISLSAAGQVTPTSIVVNCKLYNSSKSATVNVNGIGAQSVPSDFGDVSFTTSTALTSLTIASSKYIWVKSVTVNYTSGGGSTPTITKSSSMTTFGYDLSSGVANKQSFTVAGTNLSEALTVTPPAGYEISTSENGTYQTTALSFTPSTGTVSTQTIWVRLKAIADLTAGTKEGNIVCASTGATTQNVAVSGSVPFTVTWKANGETHATTYVAYATAPGTALGSLPSAPETSCGGKVLYGWYEGDYSDASIAPSVVSTSTKITADKTYNAVYANRSGSSKTYEFDITPSQFNTTSYAANNNQKSSTATATDASGATMTVKWTSNQIMKSSSNMQWQKNTSYIYNDTDLGTVNSVTITKTAGGYNTTYGTTSHPTSGAQGSGNGYFTVKENNTATGTVSLVRVNYTVSSYVYSDYSTTCGTCSENPTVGVAALKGSFSLTSVGVTCPTTGTGVGTNCSWTDYGFVWSESVANPTLVEATGNASTNCTKVQVGTSGTVSTWDGNLTKSSFELGHTYKYRAYGKNGYASGSYQYGTVATFTPRSVTFNLNSHGTSAPSTQYINNGGKVSNPSYSESVSGWRFDGWYGNAACTGNAWSFADSIVSGANRTLYAKWTQVYTVTYAYAGGSSSCSDDTKYAAGATVTVCATPPTKSGSTFLGWLGDNSIGTKAANSTFTMPAANVTLTAQWEDTEYTLTQTKGSHTASSVSATKIKSGDLSPSGKDFVYTISNIAANKGYALPKNPMLTGGGQTWTRNTNYTWTLSDDRHSATLHIAADLTISADLTINVSEVARYLVEWDEHGSIDSVYYAADDNSVTLKTGIADCGTKKFYCWTENSEFVSHASTPPTAASSGTISANKHYYAIYGDRSGGVGFEKVTSVTDGATYYIATGLTSSDQGYGGQNGSNSYGTNISLSGATFNGSNVLTAFPSSVKAVTVAISNGYFSMYDGTSYLTLTSDANNINYSNSAAYVWELTASNYYIKPKDYTRWMMFNSNRFACYSNATDKSYAYLYKSAVSWTNFAKACTLYDITIDNEITGGSIAAKNQSGTTITQAGSGNTVTVSVTPNSCKYLSALSYNDGSSHDILSTKSFTMPSSDVTITATFSTKTVSSIAPATSTHRTLMQKTSFVGEQITVTYNDGSTETLNANDATLSWSGYNMATLGDQAVKVSYDGDCGDAECEYDIEVVDGVPITFSDCGVTTVVKYDPGATVPVESRTGSYGCSGWTFLGWSATSVAHNSTTGFTYVYNFTASTPRTLYAVYVNTENSYSSIDDLADLNSGANYVFLRTYSSGNWYTPTAEAGTGDNANYLVAQNIYSNVTYSSPVYSMSSPAASYVWQLQGTAGNWYFYNASTNKYLDISTDNHIVLSSTRSDNFTITQDAYNDDEFAVYSNTNAGSNKYLSYNSSHFKGYTSSGTMYMLRQTSYFSSNPPCAPRSVTFYGNGGTVTAYGGGSSGGTLVITEAERDAGIKLPTASFSDCEGKTWTFMGWLDEERDLSRVPVLTTELLEDGVTNANHSISADDEEYWAVYSSTGEEETKHGTMTFVATDFPSSYSTGTLDKVVNGDTYEIDYKKVGYPSGSGNGIQIGKTDEYDGHIQNNTSLGKINYIRFNTFNVGSISSIHVYVGTSSSSIDTELTSAELQTIGSEYTFYPNGNYSYFKIQSAAYTGISSISVAFGLGTAIYATTPDCSTISLSGDVYVTSRNGVGIMAATPLSVEAHQLEANADVVITSNSSDVYFTTSRTPNFAMAAANQPKTSVTVTANASGELSATNIYVHYKPSTDGDGAPSDVTVYANLSPADPNIKAEHAIHVRNLPTNIVIAAKVGGAYYALPANLSGDASNPSGVLIDVDESSMTAAAPASCTYTIWPVKTVNPASSIYDRYSTNETYGNNAYGERVRFSAVNNSYKGLFANNSAGGTTINNDAVIDDDADGGTSSNTNPHYEWKITTTVTDGKWKHTLQTDQTNNQKYLRYWTAATGGPKWGTYDNGEINLYLLPVTQILDAEMTVMEWGTNSMAVKYDNAGTVASGTFKAKIGSGDKTSVTCTPLGGDIYQLTGVGDLQSNPATALTLSMTETTTPKHVVLTIPLIVTAEKTEAQLCSYAAGGNGSTLITEGRTIARNLDVIIRNGGKLTTGTAEGRFKDLYIYPGGKAKITNNLAAANVYMRGGYSFLDNKATYRYPDLCVVSGTVTTNGVKYDLYVDNRYYYTFSMPYDVTLASVTDEAGNDNFPVWVKHYNGATRASGEHVSGWEWYGDNAVTQHSFFAGRGYEITAKPAVSGRPIAIIRFPVKSGNITTDAAHAVGVSVGNYGYDDYEDGSLAANNVGWNLVGNPYFTEYKAGSASGEGDTLMIIAKGFEKNIDESTNVWDGTYKWTDANTARFITVPYDTRTDYHAEYVHDYTIPAFSAFFIQTEDEGTFYMRGTRTQAAAAPRFGTATKAKPELHVDVLLSGEGEAVDGKAGLFIHDKYEGGLKDFEDVEQWFVEQNELKTYTFADGVALSYNLTNEQAAKQTVPMGYIATVAGEHTYSINEANDVSALEHLWLTDNETGITTDLLARDYVFTTAAGRFDERFVLSAVFKQEEVITDVGDVGDSDWIHAIGVYHEGNTLTLRGLPENSAVYIYDMTGKLTASRDRLHNAASFSIAAQGVYNIRVVNGNSAVTLRSVLR